MLSETSIRAFLLILLSSCLLLTGEDVILVMVDAQEISGRIQQQTPNAVVLKSGRRQINIPRRAIHGIYDSRKALDEAKKTEAFFWLRKPFPTISLAEEAEAVATEEAVLAGRASDAETAPTGWPDPTQIQRWKDELKNLHAGKPQRQQLPWLPDNKRATAFVGVPKAYSLQQAWPLVVALHGTEDDPKNITTAFKGVVGAGCLLVAPRTTAKAFWNETGQHLNVLHCIAWMAMRFRIDPRRIVICGGSGGGMGTWSLAGAHPELYCAAGSFAGMPGIKLEDVPRLRGVPFYILHGAKDHIPVTGPRRMVAEMKRLELEHVYVEYDGDHFPPEKLRQDMRKWLQRAPPKQGASPRPALGQLVERLQQRLDGG